MIVKTHINFSVSGKDLIPKQIEEELGFSFTEACLKGDIHPKGRFKGKPRNESLAWYSEDFEYYFDTGTEISRLADVAARINDKAIEYRIEDSVFHIYFYYAAQCNLSLGQKTLTALSKLKFVNIDCIQLYDKYEITQLGEEELIQFYADGKLEKEVTLKR